MRVTDEQIKLLHCLIQRSMQHLNQGGGWQSPSVARQATQVCAGEVFSTGAYSGVTAKVSRLLRRLRGIGDGYLCFRSSCVISQDSAHWNLRGIVGLDLCQRLSRGANEPAAPIQPSLLDDL